MCLDRQLVHPLVEVHESQPLQGIGATVQQVIRWAGLGWAWLGVGWALLPMPPGI